MIIQIIEEDGVELISMVKMFTIPTLGMREHCPMLCAKQLSQLATWAL
jgi:hypothetical protein